VLQELIAVLTEACCSFLIVRLSLVSLFAVRLFSVHMRINLSAVL